MPTATILPPRAFTALSAVAVSGVDGTVLLMHDMIRGIGGSHREERAGTDMKGHEVARHAARVKRLHQPPA